MNLKRVIFSGIAIYQEHQSSHACSPEPCADPVGEHGGYLLACTWFLEFAQLMRDLVRLQCYAGLRRYQEEGYVLKCARPQPHRARG